MNTFLFEQNKLVLKRDHELIILEPWGTDILRFRSTTNKEIMQQDYTLLKQPETIMTCKIEEHKAFVENGILSATLESSGKITYFKDGVELLSERSEVAFQWKFRDYKNKGKETFSATVLFQSYEDEHFYGLGQEQNDCFDLKGSTSQLIHINTKTTIPFVYSSRNYGFLWNHPGIGRCELTNNHTLWHGNQMKQIDYLIIAGREPKDILNKYAHVTGFAPKFPEWASGLWQSKLRYEDQEELLSVATEYKKRGLPLSAIVIDYFHWTEQGDWKFDSTYWPDPTSMCKQLEVLNIKPIVSIWPTINPASCNYDVMNQNDYLINRKDQEFGVFDFHGPQTYLDSTNPDTRAFVWKQVQENYYKHGIKNFWLDEAEPEIVPAHFDNLDFYLGDGEEVALLYPYYYAKLFFEGLQKSGEEDIILLIRSAWIGSQRYGTLVWNGDIPSTFEALRMSVKSGLHMSMCGIPWWNSDIGGFWGADIESDYFKELIIRWFQFGIFCPVTRLHGSRNKTTNQVERNPGVKEPRGGDNELWSFGESVYQVLKNLLELRERLRPYVHNYMDIASTTGVSIMRPMFLEFPEDSCCYSLGDQYMFGEDILFAPIVAQGQLSRDVYLPSGNWIDVNNKVEYMGPANYTITTNPYEFIAFVKKGSSMIDVF